MQWISLHDAWMKEGLDCLSVTVLLLKCQYAVTTWTNDRLNYSHILCTSFPFLCILLLPFTWKSISALCNLSSCLKIASESSLAWRQIIIKHYRVCSSSALILIPLQVQVSHELALYHWSVAADLKKPTLSRPQWERFFFFSSTCHMACQMLNRSVKSVQPWHWPCQWWALSIR